MRRDFAATGLFAMQSDGLLTPIQALVSIVTITLFVPCIASIFMMIKERGWKIGLGMTVFIFPFAFLVGACCSDYSHYLVWEAFDERKLVILLGLRHKVLHAGSITVRQMPPECQLPRGLLPDMRKPHGHH
jgi:hypothetical protein